MIKVRRIGHATFETPDLDRQIEHFTQVTGLVIACPFRKLLVEFRNATVQLVPLRPHVLDQHAHSLTESFNLSAHFRELSFEFASALRNYDAAFKQDGPQLIDQRRPFPYQSITRAMQGLHVKLLLAL